MLLNFVPNLAEHPENWSMPPSTLVEVSHIWSNSRQLSGRSASGGPPKSASRPQPAPEKWSSIHIRFGRNSGSSKFGPAMGDVHHRHPMESAGTCSELEIPPYPVLHGAPRQCFVVVPRGPSFIRRGSSSSAVLQPINRARALSKAGVPAGAVPKLSHAMRPTSSLLL